MGEFKRSAMTTLADEFLADLEELDDDSGEDDAGQDLGDMDVDEPEDAELVLDSLKQTNVSSVAKLLKTDRAQELLKQIDEMNAQGPAQPGQAPGLNEVDPEYQMIVECNSVISEIDLEVDDVHKFIRDRYCIKFPELESLVPNALDYARVVNRIGNETEMANIDLSGILPSATIMVVSVTGSTTNGTPLTAEEMAVTIEGCEEMFNLDAAKQKILSFVEGRLLKVAPNLTYIIGSEIAAKMLGVAGGLSAIAKLTSNTLLSLGAQKKNLSGMSSRQAEVHFGVIQECEVVRNNPPALKRRVMRLVSGKATLAARVDEARTHPTGAAGQAFRKQIEDTIEKWLEPPPARQIKALAAPDDAPRKTRGGKRMRKIKEKYQSSDLMQQASRVAFASQDEGLYTGNTMESLGMIGHGATGKIRMSAAEEKNIKAAGEKALKRMRVASGQGGGNKSLLGGSSVVPGRASTINGARSAIGGARTNVSRRSAGTTSGISSSLVFTPIQGIELGNPDAEKQKAVDRANASYFSNTGKFGGK